MSRGGAEVLLVLILLAVAISAFAFLVAILTYVVMGIMALSAFMAFAWSLVCLFAWRNHLRLGRLFVHKEDARAFIIRGVFGALTLPAFIALADYFADLPFQVPWEHGFYFALGGYSFFSVGFEYLVARKKDVPYVIHEPLPVSYPPQPRQEILPPPARQQRLPHYASWDDEEVMR